MAEQITWENDTHWRTSDVQRVIRLAMAEAGADMSEPRRVTVSFPTKKTKNPSRVHVVFRSSTGPSKKKLSSAKLTSEVILTLPKRGSSDPHPVAMVAIAANWAVAGKVDADATLLPFSSVYFLANYLAQRFAAEAEALYEDEDGSIKAKRNSLRSDARSSDAPAWGDVSKLYIAKYKDPLKDGTYLSFVAKKETAIKRETTNVERLEKELKATQKKLRDAKRRKKAAEKAIKDATERRTT